MDEDVINILVIDDSKYDRELIKTKLKKHFTNAVFVFGEGVEDYKERATWVKPDVIICDYEMKDCNGLEILLLSKEAWDVPFIFVTGALNDEERVAQTILKGANGYVLKDNLDDLYRVVKEALLSASYQKEKKKDKEELFNIILLELDKVKNLILKEGSYSELLSVVTQIESKIDHVRA